MALIRTPHTYLAAFLALGSFACGPEKPDDTLAPPPLRTITSADALTAANRNLKNALVTGAQNANFLSDSKIFGVFGTSDRAPCPVEGPCDQPTTTDLQRQAAESADAIAAQILNAANIELAEPTKIVLRLKPEVACANTSSAVDFVPVGNCQDSYSGVAVRLELSSRNEGDVDVRLTVDNTPLATLELYASSLAVELDLGAAITAFNKMMTAGGDADQVLAGTFQGRLRAELSITSARQIDLGFSIASALLFDMTIDGNRYRFEAGVANPLVAARIDGVTNKLTITSNSGGAKLLAPLAVLSGSETCTTGPNGEQICEPRTRAEGDLEIRIPSSSATFEIGDGDTISGEMQSDDAISVRHNGVEVMSFDVNANTGRRIDWSVLLGQDDVSVELGSALSAVARLNLASLGSVLEVPSWAVSETFTLDINGAARPSMKMTVSSGASVVSPGDPAPQPQPGQKAAVEMTAGVLRLAALNANQSVVVAAGQCLYSRDTVEGETHPLQSLEGRACE